MLRLHPILPTIARSKHRHWVLQTLSKLVGLDDIKEILGEIDQAAEMDIEELEQQAKAVKDGTPNSVDADHAGDGA